MSAAWSEFGGNQSHSVHYLKGNGGCLTRSESPGHDGLLSAGAEFKNDWSCTSTTQYVFMTNFYGTFLCRSEHDSVTSLIFSELIYI